MINRVVNAFISGDSKELASCFSENCSYIDYCPALEGESIISIYGSICMAMLFKNKFATGRITIADPLVEGENCASFFCSYYGSPYVFSRFRIYEYDGSGLIKKAVILPA